MSFGTTGQIRRPTKTAAIGVALLALTLAGCGSDDTPSGGSTSTTSTTPSHSTATSPASPSSTPSATATTPDPTLVADCTAVNGVLTGVSTQYPDGPNLTVGKPPTETNVAALTAIRDGFNGLTLTNTALIKREKTALRAIAKIIAAPTVALTQKMVDAFNDAGTKLSTICTGVNPS